MLAAASAEQQQPAPPSAAVPPPPASVFRKQRSAPSGVKPRVVVWAHGVSSLAPSPKAAHRSGSGPPPGQYYSARPWPVQTDAHGGGSVPPCDNCGAAESPQWRKGPPHAPRLCNACGARYLRTRSLEPAGGAGGVARRTSVSLRRVSETLVSAAAVAAAQVNGALLKPEVDDGAGARAVEASPLVQRGAPGVPFSPGGAANVLLMLLSAGSTGEEGDAVQAAVVAPVDGDAGAAAAAQQQQQGVAPPRRRSSQNVTASMQRAQPAGVDAAAAPLAGSKGAKRKLEALTLAPTAKKGGDSPDGAPVAVAALDGGADTPMPTSAAARGGKRRRTAQGAVRSVSASASDDEPQTAAAAAAAATTASVDAAAGQAGGAACGALIPRMKTHRPWTLAEVRALVDGVSLHGRGQWADIKASAGEVLGTRSSVDVKDKWRNLLRISSLPQGTEPRRSGDALPQELLHRVRALSAPMPANGADALAAAAAMPPPAQLAPAAPAAAAASAVVVAAVSAPLPLEAAAATATAPLESECGAGPATAAVHRGSSLTRSKHHSPWSLEESTALVEGVAAAQGCKWTAIKAMDLPGLAHRTAIDLKDRWRNLLALPSSSRRKQDVPQELLARVLQLEAAYGVTRRKGRQ